MPQFGTSVSHGLGRDEAIVRLKQQVQRVATESGGKVTNFAGTWAAHKFDFSFLAMGLSINGSMIVEERAVYVDGTIPFAALLFKGQIESTLAAELKRILA